MNLKNIIVGIFITLGIILGTVNNTNADTDCDAILDECLEGNPYTPEWVFPSLHNAYDQGCQNSHGICVRQVEED